jgi:hypothetical protein
VVLPSVRVPAGAFPGSGPHLICCDFSTPGRWLRVGVISIRGKTRFHHTPYRNACMLPPVQPAALWGVFLCKDWDSPDSHAFGCI